MTLESHRVTSVTVATSGIGKRKCTEWIGYLIQSTIVQTVGTMTQKLSAGADCYTTYQNPATTTGRACMEGQMSTTVERVKEHAQALSIDGQVGKWLPLRGLLAFLSSLEKERCVWKASDSPYYYWELSCHGGGSNDQANTSWEYCPYCGKRIEVKEADHDRD
jgi:hypothetical protein